MADRAMGRLAWIAAAMLAAPAPAADFVTVRNVVTVDAPVARVWARVGGWCAIADWLAVTCEQTAGAGDVGSVRRLNGATLEAMVAKGPLAYTYWQTAGNMAAYGYHGTLAAEAAGERRTRLTYTLVYDQAGMPSDAVRAAEHTRLDTRFAGALAAMKRLAERPQ